MTILKILDMGFFEALGRPLSVLRLTRLVDRHRATSTRSLAALEAVWILCAVFGVQIVADAPVWPMDAFRDRFLTAYGRQPPPQGAPAVRR